MSTPGCERYGDETEHGEGGLVGLSDLDVAVRLKTTLWGGYRVVAFVGAGVSMAAGYPDWPILINRIHDVLNEVAGNSTLKRPLTLGQ